MSENKECLFYIDHNPLEYSGTLGGAIHKGACKVNSTDCKDTDGCFIKKLYSKLQTKEQECEELKEENYQLQKNCQICEYFIDGIPCKPLRDMDYDLQDVINQRDKYKQALDEIEKLIPKFDTSDGCSYGDYDCENCSDLDEAIVCAYKLKKIIKGIISKVRRVDK